jgi:HD-GYP domain-containing protein (c-di-GMP phosphodiesterase class II)
VLHQELRQLRQADWGRYRHAVATAAVAARMQLSALGHADAVPGLVAAALLHDLGMRHLPGELLRSRGPLDADGMRQVAAHPLLGAWHLAAVLGRHPAVEAALGHHWRLGRGYPQLRVAPPRSVDVVAVASAFVALTHPRPFRGAAYDARAAVDLLVADALAGETDVDAVKLLVHALRGAHGQVREIRFARQRPGPHLARPPHPTLSQQLAAAQA